MKAILVMFDSLNRRMLPPYGCDWVHAPNFTRLAQHSLTFDRSYVGSMPCMPARRELHTGRYNFLHRSWGPLEPFDDSMPEILRSHHIYTHLISDHYHYWEDGGCTYHTRYNSWEISRGQEGDPWKGEVADPIIPPSLIQRKGSRLWRQDWVNRKYMDSVEKQSQAVTFELGLDFIRKNHGEDNWFLHLETFDPHEPFFTQQQFKALYPHPYDGPHFDWPNYAPVKETPEQVAHARYGYAALVSMCDAYLGKVLDAMDQYNLWEDTLLIVNTDHGFLLGEHDWWAKCIQPFYNEVAQTPLFIWDPRSRNAGEHRQALVQTIDIPATLLEFFNIPLPRDMQGHPLREVIANDQPVRTAALYGIHGGHVNITDGRYVYMRAPAAAKNSPLFNYTVMPTHMNHLFSVEELQTSRLAPPFTFTKNVPLLQVDASGTYANAHQFGTLLFDLDQDPTQERPLQDPDLEARMVELLRQLLHESDAPAEQFERLGLK